MTERSNVFQRQFIILFTSVQKYFGKSFIEKKRCRYNTLKSWAENRKIKLLVSHINSKRIIFFIPFTLAHYNGTYSTRIDYSMWFEKVGDIHRNDSDRWRPKLNEIGTWLEKNGSCDECVWPSLMRKHANWAQNKGFWLLNGAWSCMYPIKKVRHGNVEELLRLAESGSWPNCVRSERHHSQSCDYLTFTAIEYP